MDVRRFLLMAGIAAMLCGCGTAEPSAPAVTPETARVVVAAATRVPIVLPTPSPSPAPSPTPVPTVFSAPEGAYTFGWISDPQHYSAKYPDTYRAMTSFLEAERARLNLQYVVCTGDLVNDYADAAQWAVADEAFGSIVSVPYGVLGGNHDIRLNAEDGYDNYFRCFGADRFIKNSCYAASYENNLGHCDLIDAGNTKYVFVYMTLRQSDAAYAFALDCFQKYPDRIGVLCLHDYCDGSMKLTDEGRRYYERVVEKADNLYLVLCGHRYGVSQRTDIILNSDGSSRQVLTMLQNYQAAADGGRGYLTLLRIDEEAGLLNVQNYSPVYDDVDLFDEKDMYTKNYTEKRVTESVILPLPWKTS